MEKQYPIFTDKNSTEDLPEINMQRCPHFNGCSQNFCPLDPDLNLRSGKARDKCRFMREPKLAKIRGREFVSGGTVMPDAILNFVPRGNIERLNARSQTRWRELTAKKEI
jgi:hypothetical protein